MSFRAVVLLSFKNYTWLFEKGIQKKGIYEVKKVVNAGQIKI